jgi:hypothetical protein
MKSLRQHFAVSNTLGFRFREPLVKPHIVRGKGMWIARFKGYQGIGLTPQLAFSDLSRFLAAWGAKRNSEFFGTD